MMTTWKIDDGDTHDAKPWPSATLGMHTKISSKQAAGPSRKA